MIYLPLQLNVNFTASVTQITQIMAVTLGASVNNEGMLIETLWSCDSVNGVFLLCSWTYGLLEKYVV